MYVEYPYEYDLERILSKYEIVYSTKGTFNNCDRVTDRHYYPVTYLKDLIRKDVPSYISEYDLNRHLEYMVPNLWYKNVYVDPYRK